MSSSWADEARAVLRKEALTEMRSRAHAYTALMLAGVTVFTLAFAYFGRTPSAEAAAGMLWAALVFAGAGTLARAFVAEEEGGTGDLLRMWARPHAVFWGKTAYAFLQMTVTAALSALLFLVLTGAGAANVPLLAAMLLGGSAALAGAVTLVSALIARGSNRGTLAGVVALPLLLPVVALGTGAARAAIDGVSPHGWAACLGVWSYAVAVLAFAPYQFAAVWSER
jgi:heme exporter protein B